MLYTTKSRDNIRKESDISRKQRHVLIQLYDPATITRKQEMITHEVPIFQPVEAQAIQPSLNFHRASTVGAL
ncbi:hypothetical protein K7569_05055 [Stenotrophomonas maltophilia]|nr:hypothetical protein L681_09725 [Stenotrophomonas maltophilia MF89]UXB41162.1 hypothetical protein K7569_05055 [Stenotrophomonas maltophilia]